MNRVEAEREVERLEAHQEFELRMGCPPALAEAPLRERLIEAIAESSRLADELKEAREDAHEWKQSAEDEEQRAEGLRRDLDDLQVDHDVLRKQHEALEKKYDALKRIEVVR